YLASPISRIAVNNNDLGDQIAGQVGEHAAYSLRFVMGRDYDRYSHAGSLITTTGMRDGAEPARRRCPKPDRRVRRPVPAMRGPEPTVPRPRRCPTPRSKGCRDTEKRRMRRDGSAIQC